MITSFPEPIKKILLSFNGKLLNPFTLFVSGLPKNRRMRG